MTELPPVPPNPATSASASWRQPGRLKIAALVLVSAFAGAAASSAARHWYGHHGMGFMSGPMDAAEIDRRVDWMTGRLARDINASDTQREKLATIAKTAAKDLMPMRETMRDARKQARELLGQPAVDRAAIEKLRADQLGNFDAISKRLSTALADAAEVLTPEQRKELAKRLPPHKGWRDGDDRG
jgi:periplasmic protein CpxP/Spy